MKKRREKSFFERISITTLICIIFILMQISSVTLLGMLIIKYNERELMQTAIQKYVDYGVSISNDLWNHRENYEADAKVLLSMPSIVDLIENIPQPGQEDCFSKEVSRLIEMSGQQYLYMSDVTLYTKDGRSYHYGAYDHRIENAMRSVYYEYAFRFPNYIVWMGWNPEIEKYEFVKLSYDGEYNINGLLVYRFEPSFFRRTLLDDTNLNSTGFFLLDESKNIQYSNHVNLIGKPLPDDFSVDQQNRTGYYEKDGQVVFYQFIKGMQPEINHHRWLVVVSVDANELFGSIGDSYKFVIYYCLLAVTLGVVLVPMVMSVIARPIKMLTLAMQRATWNNGLEAGPALMQGLTCMTRETTILVDTFKKMIMSNHKLLKDIQAEKSMRREIESHVLDNQLSAHFILNTLQVIALKAEEDGGKGVCESIAELGYLLKESLRKGEMLVSVKDETEYIKKYISIVSAKYEEKIEFVTDVGQDTENCLVPRFILQPLVENAVNHGVAMKLGSGKVTVQVFKVNDRLKLEVEDDGLGMTQERLCQVLDSLASDSGTDAHGNDPSIGLRNVYQRLALIYQQDFGFTIESERYFGTNVRIELPARETCKQLGEGRNVPSFVD